MEISSVASVVRTILDLVKALRSERNGLGVSESMLATLPDTLDHHLQEVARWSEEIRFVGMAERKETDRSSTALKFDIPRRFRPIRANSGETEADLLSRNQHIVLLGDPGAGKSTTLKRIARSLLTQGSSDPDGFQYPILVVLRDLRPDMTLVEAISDRIGIVAPVGDAARLEPSVSPPNQIIPVKWSLATTLHFILDTSHAVVLLDGLDEIAPEMRRRIIAESEAIGRHLDQGKLILTCRSGAYQQQISGFDILEICPLTPEQIKEIVTLWLTPPLAMRFLDELKSLPFQNLCARPLMLCQLLVQFGRYNGFPEQPAEVYRRSVRLMLEAWDSERGIVRISKYSGFDPERKMSFLSTLAYFLTYQKKTATFSEADLVAVYHKIHRSFQLPENEAEQVAREIETHTGIIATTETSIANSSLSYEFWHLSIQEYLCAEYLVRSPIPELLPQYADTYPAPLAVAVALSPDPVNWLATLVLRKQKLLNHARVSEFLVRLQIERPWFQPSELLGMIYMKLLFDYGESEGISDLMSTDIGLHSVAEALAIYDVLDLVGPPDQRVIKLTRRHKWKSHAGFEAPLQLMIPLAILQQICRQNIPVRFLRENGQRLVQSLSKGLLN